MRYGQAGLRRAAWLGLIGWAAATGLQAQDDTPAAIGRYGDLINAQIVPIHDILLPSGKILYFDRHDHGTHHDRLMRIWNPADNSITLSPDPGYDIFCAGHSYLRDGTILFTGGHLTDFTGMPGMRIYHPKTNTFDTNLPNMNAARWYPTNATLPNGDVVIVAGDISPNNANPLPQVYEAKTRTLRTLDSARLIIPWYPFIYVASETRVFMAGVEPMTRFLETKGRGKWIDLGSTVTKLNRQYGTSVMYEPGKILIAGGNQAQPTATAETIDLNAAAPKWTQIESMKWARRFPTATMLPDGKVLVTGGTSAGGFNNATGAVFSAEMWDPATGKWTTWAKNSTVRIYHSIALLLPDGRVLTGGGGNPSDEAHGDVSHKDFQMFEPPYLFKGARPAIDSAPDTLRFGGEFALRTRNLGNLQVTLLKLAAVTHAFNQNQNFNRLPVRRLDAGTLAVGAPKDSIATQPGPHLLFLLDSAGIPSVGKVVWVESGKGPTSLNRPGSLIPGALRGDAAARVGADGRRAAPGSEARQVRFPAGREKVKAKAKE